MFTPLRVAWVLSIEGHTDCGLVEYYKFGGNGVKYMVSITVDTGALG